MLVTNLPTTAAASSQPGRRVRSVKATVRAIQATTRKAPTAKLKMATKTTKKKVRFLLSPAEEVKAHLRQAEAETALEKARAERICCWNQEEDRYPRDLMAEELPEPEIQGGTTALG